MNHFLLFIFFLSVFTASQCPASKARFETIDKVIEQAQNNILTKQRDDGHWNFGSFLGINFISEYAIALRLLPSEFSKKTKFDPSVLRKLLYDTQLEDGSWMNVVDQYKNEGDIDSSIFNYWALKVLGDDPDSPVLSKAREYILKKGGIDSLQTMTKIWLCLFGNYPWSEISEIPLFVFGTKFSFFQVQNQVAQWVYPHVVAIAYLRNYNFVKFLGDEFSLRELYLPGSTTPSRLPEKTKETIDGEYNIKFYRKVFGLGVSIDNLVERILDIQQPKGSFGAYTVSTLFSIIALSHYSKSRPEMKKKLSPVIEKGFEFIEWEYFDQDDVGCSYLGVLDDGHYWDTLLASIALMVSSEDNFSSEIETAVTNSAKYVAEAQVENGGIPYGWDFAYAPDFDDTSELALLFADLLHRLNLPDSNLDSKEKKEINQNLGPKLVKAVEWLLDVQNSDGGWAAFDKDRQGLWIVKKLLRAFTNSAELFDPSCPDIVGHIFEAFAAVLKLPKDLGFLSKKIGLLEKKIGEGVGRAIEYLKGFQDSDGKFEGRWGSNYVYGTGAVLAGLGKVCKASSEYENVMSEKWVAKASDWLISKQQDDGSWGETGESYLDISLAGVGVSTPSQTAWSLLGLLEVYNFKKSDSRVGEAIEKGVDWLIKDFEASGGKWVDQSLVGTGHRGILMMQYLAYAPSWPLMTLGRFKQVFESVNEECVDL